jgi:hypothetical protein
MVLKQIVKHAHATTNDFSRTNQKQQQLIDRQQHRTSNANHMQIKDCQHTKVSSKNKITKNKCNTKTHTVTTVAQKQKQKQKKKKKPDQFSKNWRRCFTFTESLSTGFGELILLRHNTKKKLLCNKQCLMKARGWRLWRAYCNTVSLLNIVSLTFRISVGGH